MAARMERKKKGPPSDKGPRISVWNPKEGEKNLFANQEALKHSRKG